MRQQRGACRDEGQARLSSGSNCVSHAPRLLHLITAPLFISGSAVMAAAENKQKKPSKPRVLLLGDSISIDYTPTVIQLLSDDAEVFRPMHKNRNSIVSENCKHTEYGLKNLDRWLGQGGEEEATTTTKNKWDVIHFNFGLHDLKYIDDQFPKPPKVSQRGQDAIQSNPTARQLATIETYTTNLEKIVIRLKKTGATLIFCTTTPVPKDAAGRISDDSVRYNEAALLVMKKHEVDNINDLHAFATKHHVLSDIQQPRDVHFTEYGSVRLGLEVARHIRMALNATRDSNVKGLQSAQERDGP